MMARRQPHERCATTPGTSPITRAYRPTTRRPRTPHPRPAPGSRHRTAWWSRVGCHDAGGNVGRRGHLPVPEDGPDHACRCTPNSAVTPSATASSWVFKAYITSPGLATTVACGSAMIAGAARSRWSARRGGPGALRTKVVGGVCDRGRMRVLLVMWRVEASSRPGRPLGQLTHDLSVEGRRHLIRLLENGDRHALVAERLRRAPLRCARHGRPSVVSNRARGK